MKKILCWFLIFVFLLGTLGCSKKAELPEGVENKEFYSDMIKCLELTKKILEAKNKKYLDELSNISKKYYTSSKNKNFNKKEMKILAQATILQISLSNYIEAYFENEDYDANKLIDTNKASGRRVLKDIQEFVSLLELDEDFYLED